MLLSGNDKYKDVKEESDMEKQAPTPGASNTLPTLSA